ncbi:MAG TPA: 6-pyruvoyl-tetrahydropterin synthase-related protein [Geomonas sp.]|nr:6-pyruvoyl-tetrahydropterin synthase-related protein [Geomonas sp.]
MELYSQFEKRKRYLVFFCLIVLAVIASSPLSFHSWFKGDDCIIHLIRSNDVCYEISAGDFYPRFLTQACFGKGLPTLNFYSPAFYLMVGYLNAVGIHIVAAMTLVCAASFLVGGWGMYLWTRKYCGEMGAMLAAAIYIFAPYHLVDIYLRGALPEFVALSILPLLFHAMDLCFSSERSLRGIVWTGVASAAIVLTHNLTVVTILPFAVCYFVWCFFHYQATWRKGLLASLGPLLGAGLSSFYWIPVLLERKDLLGTGVAITKSLHYSRHFMSIPEFFRSGEFSVFALSPMYVLVFVCVALSITALLSKESEKGFGVLAMLCCLASVVLTLSISTPLYQAIPALQYLQFPYRFLGPATLFLSAFCAFVPGSKLLAGHRKACWGVCCLIILLCIPLSGGLRKVEGELPSFPPNPVAFGKNSYPIFRMWSDSDFMPADSSLSRGDVVEFPMLSNGQMAVPLTNYRTAGSTLSCRVALQQGADLVGPWLYFPGWKARCDNSELPVSPDRNGLIAVTIPAGVHDIQVWFGTTKPRVAGWAATGITLAILASCLLLHRRSRPGRD